MATRATASRASAPVIEIPETDVRQISTGILGFTPYIHNRMAEKARREILFPKGRKNAAERASTLKHDPVQEFRASPYTLDGDDSPTLLAVMASSFKGAMMTAALDLPGVKSTQIGRLVWVDGYRLPLWGGAKLLMAVTRSADMNKTPDIRTRAISGDLDPGKPQWGTVITVKYVAPLITDRTIVNLLSTGGMSAGVGDWRTQKGKGTFGQFQMCNIDDPRLLEVQKMDRAVQQAALDAAEPFDEESRELLDWYLEERQERGR